MKQRTGLNQTRNCGDPLPKYGVQPTPLVRYDLELTVTNSSNPGAAKIVSRIRVVFSIGALHGGGSERQIVSALTHLDRDRFEPYLYVVYRSGPLLSLIPEDVPIAAFEERDSRAPTRIFGGMHRRRVQDMRRYLQEIRADVCYDRTFLMTLVSADAAQSLNIPNISTVVTNPSTGFAPVAGRFRWLKKRSLRRLYRSSACVLAVSNGAARGAEQFYGLETNSVITQYNGVDLTAIRSAATESVDSTWWNAPAPHPKRVIRIVSAGRLNHEKGFHLLISALAQLKREWSDTHLRLALLGEGNHRLQLQNQIDSAKLGDNVRLAGFQNNAAAWYRSADVFVLPSLVEGMPNVLLEAMALGTPVISSRCPYGPEEILENGMHGALCEPDSVTGLTSTIRDVVLDLPAAEKRAASATSRVESVFSQDVAVRRLENIIFQVVHRKGS
ncbi:MAG: glycosyltransferase [Fuerstiella sp.]|nr:glycosyltransferase [Fuerstiella sp.]